MPRLSPHCDRHPNLQMVPCLLRRTMGMVAGHVCPVPGCGRHFVENSYLEEVEVRTVKASIFHNDALRSAGEKSLAERSPGKPNRPLNRNAAARAAILKAIEESRRS